MLLSSFLPSSFPQKLFGPTSKCEPTAIRKFRDFYAPASSFSQFSIVFFCLSLFWLFQFKRKVFSLQAKCGANATLNTSLKRKDDFVHTGEEFLLIYQTDVSAREKHLFARIWATQLQFLNIGGISMTILTSMTSFCQN